MASFLFCLPRFHTNAAPWVRVLQEAGHKVEVHCVIRGPTENHDLLEPHIHTQSRWSVRLGGSAANDRRLFPEFRAISDAMRRADPDVVIVRGLTRWFMRMAVLAAVLQGRKLVVYDQESPNPRLSGTWLRRAACRVAGIPHFTSILDDAGRWAMGSALQMPFGCAFDDADIACLSRRDLHWPPRILMVAKYRKRKRHTDLLTALAKLAPTHEFSLTFCGEEASDADRKFCRELQSRADMMGIGDRLTFANSLPHRAMPQIYGTHDIFVLPAIREPAAVSPMEAAWCGCAVIVARGGGTRTYLPPGDRFDFVDGDADDLARALSGLLQRPHELAQAREQCIQRISTVAGAGQVRDRFESLLI